MPNATIHCLSLNPALDIATVAEKVQSTHKIRVSEQIVYPGGGAINVARVVDALNGDVSLTYLAGGAYGQVMQNAVNSLNLSSHCISTDTDTRVSYTVHERLTGREFRFVSSGSAIADAYLQSAITHVDSISCDILVLSGSLPVNAPTDTYAQIALSAADKGIKVVLDCSGEALKCALDTGCIYLVKPSFTELEQLAGKKLDESSAIQFAKSLVQQKLAAIVAVSMGKHGAFVCTQNNTIRSPAVKVRVRSAVGAGDSFVAGMTTQLASGKSLEEAFRYGIAAGAAAVMTSGTNLCEVENIRKLLAHVVGITSSSLTTPLVG